MIKFVSIRQWLSINLKQLIKQSVGSAQESAVIEMYPRKVPYIHESCAHRSIFTTFKHLQPTILLSSLMTINKETALHSIEVDEHKPMWRFANITSKPPEELITEGDNLIELTILSMMDSASRPPTVNKGIDEKLIDGILNGDAKNAENELLDKFKIALISEHQKVVRDSLESNKKPMISIIKEIVERQDKFFDSDDLVRWASTLDLKDLQRYIENKGKLMFTKYNGL